MKRARSLIVIASTPPTRNYENFTEVVRNYTNNPPFNLKVPDAFKIQKKFKTFISIYAAYLYDSVYLYARALDRLIKAKQEELKKNNSFITEDIIREIASNGTSIIGEIIKQHSYTSVTGYDIHIDNNGDSEGNFSVIVLKPHNFSTRDGNFTCNYHLLPLASFIASKSDGLPEFKFNNIERIEWPGGVVPQDEPQCGFENELCNKDDSHVTSMIIAVILGLVLFCSIVITISIYRKWKIELEIEGLLWKIEPQEIKGYFTNDIVSSPSKLSLVSAASYGSRYQVWTTTGQLRGVIVRIKELKFSKRKDISRELMKEFRTLRELRHDNINSFIGRFQITFNDD